MLAPTKPIKSCECGSPCGGCCGCTKESIGLGNVDNTSDLNKPLSTDMVNALSGKVGLDIFTQLKNRVDALESTITEIPDLKVRIGQCELDIIDHYEAIKRLQSTTKSMADTITELGNRVTGVNDALVTVGTRVDALETKDSNNVKLSGVSVQTIQGTLKANDPASGATDDTLVTANWISQTGDEAPNNVSHRYGNETISGIKTYSDRINGTIQLSNVVGKYGYEGWYKALDLGAVANYIQIKITVFTATYRIPTQYAELLISNNDIPQIAAIVSKGSDATHADPSNYGVMAENGRIIFYAKKLNFDMAMVVNVEYKTSYGEYVNPDIRILGEQTSDPTGLSGFVTATSMIG